MKLHWQILLAIGLAVVAALLLTPEHGIGSFTFVAFFDFLGKLFLNALKMIVVPLILSSIICGVANAGAGESIGRMGMRTMIYYMGTSLLAILMGLVLVNLTRPGIIDGQPAGDRLNLSSSEQIESTLQRVEGRSGSDFVNVILDMFPSNVVAAAADDRQLLGVIVFGLLFGLFMLRISPGPLQTLKSFWQGVYEVMMAMTLFIMRFAPIGVFGLVATTLINTGFGVLKPMLVFFFTVFAALVLHMFVTLALLVRYLAKVRPVNLYRAMLPALLTAFSTASSSATLPVTIESIEKNTGVSKRVSSFTLPLGATVNMDGTALYECAAALFIAQAYGLDLSFGQQFLVVVIALLTSVGVAGIPAASLVAIAIILAAIGLPVEALGLLLVTDRLLDMMRTAVNVYSDGCCAVIIARAEGEDNLFPASPPSTPG